MGRERTTQVVKWMGIALILLLILAGCSNSGERANDANERAGIVVNDQAGAEITLPARVERVACLTEICVDSLAELGLEPVAVVPSSIAFQPEFYGEHAASFVQIGGGFMEPSLEDIARSRPDVVIGLKGTHDMLREGLGSIAPLYIVDVRTYEDSLSFLEMMGAWTGKDETAQQAAQQFKDKLAGYKQAAPGDQSALILYGSDLNFGIDTAGSLVGGLLAELTPYPWPAPTEDTGHQAGGMAYSLEMVLETDPQHIFIETFGFSPDALPLSEQFTASPIWDKLQAVQEKRFTEVRTPIWANGRGTRSLSIVMDEAMHALYPETFKGEAFKGETSKGSDQ